MRNPLYDALCQTLGSYTISFHTPGHKYKAMHDLSLMRIDTTEIDGTDHLHYAEGILKEAQERAAVAYGSRKAFFLINGTTVGIHAMIRTAVGPGKKLVIQRDAHKSVFNACALYNIPIHVLEPQYNQQLGIPKGISLTALEALLRKDKTIAAVLLTSPNYYGLNLDLRQAAKVCHANGVLLLVDEAHGAHFAFSALLPDPAVCSGADMVCQSTHKTLPAMTQCAMLHVCSDRVQEDKLAQHLEAMQSSSPSYVLMNAIDYAIHFASLHGDRLVEALCRQLAVSRKSLKRQIGLKDYQRTFKQWHPDPLRWIIPSEPFNMTGYALEKRLREHYGIQMELSSQHFVLAIITMLNSQSEIEALENALVKIAMETGTKTHDSTVKIKSMGHYKPVITLQQAFDAEGESIALKDACGRVLQTALVPYPPGVPLVLPGERLTLEHLHHLENIRNNQSISGLEKDNIRVIKNETIPK